MAGKGEENLIERRLSHTHRGDPHAGLAESERKALLKVLGVTRDPAKRGIEDALAAFAKRGYIVNAGGFHPQINVIAVPIVVVGSGQAR